jgi:hypothetical protein
LVLLIYLLFDTLNVGLGFFDAYLAQTLEEALVTPL